MFAAMKDGGEHEPAKRDEFQGVPAAVPDRRSLRSIFVSAALDGGVCVPQVRRNRLLPAARTAGVCLQTLPPAEFGHGGNCSAPHPPSTDDLVLDNLSGSLPKKYLQSYLDEYCFCFSRRDFDPLSAETPGTNCGNSTRLS